MAEELRLALILLGSLAIGAVILHGIWTVRKTVNEERAQAKEEAKEEPEEMVEEDLETQSLKLKQMEMDFNVLQKESSEKDEGLPVVDVDVDSIYEKSPDEVQVEILDEIESEQSVKNDFDAEDDTVEDITIAHVTHHDEGPHEVDLGNFSAISHDEINDFDVALDTGEAKVEAEKQVETVEQEVLMLFVDKEQGAPIEGAKLLPVLLTLGFKFGEMDFFHRHQDNSGKGAVLFSLANMYNPGTFDIDNMEQMSTRGLTIFMTLPNAAEPLQTFNMMHNAAKKIADEFDAQVLDHKRQPIDVAIVRGYVEKIRKFQG